MQYVSPLETGSSGTSSTKKSPTNFYWNIQHANNARTKYNHREKETKSLTYHNGDEEE